MTYSVVSTTPLECFCLKKHEFYEYIGDVARKAFMKYLRVYPSDGDLRRFYHEQMNWMDFRRQVQSDRTGGKPPAFARRDAKRMAEIEQEDR